jgi:hypothetical protein
MIIKQKQVMKIAECVQEYNTNHHFHLAHDMIEELWKLIMDNGTIKKKGIIFRRLTLSTIVPIKLWVKNSILFKQLVVVFIMDGIKIKWKFLQMKREKWKQCIT